MTEKTSEVSCFCGSESDRVVQDKGPHQKDKEYDDTTEVVSKGGFYTSLLFLLDPVSVTNGYSDFAFLVHHKSLMNSSNTVRLAITPSRC